MQLRMETVSKEIYSGAVFLKIRQNLSELR